MDRNFRSMMRNIENQIDSINGKSKCYASKSPY